MITIDFIWSVFLFVSIPLLLIFLSWIAPFQSRPAFRKLAVEKEGWHCNVCTYSYFIFESDVFMSECPRCGSLNKREESVSI